MKRTWNWWTQEANTYLVYGCRIDKFRNGEINICDNFGAKYLCYEIAYFYSCLLIRRFYACLWFMQFMSFQCAFACQTKKKSEWSKKRGAKQKQTGKNLNGKSYNNTIKL